MINMEFSSKNKNIIKLVFATMSLILSQDLKAFLMKSSDSNNFNVFYNADILPTLGRESSKLPMHDVIKSCMGKQSIQSTKQSDEYYCNKIRKYHSLMHFQIKRLTFNKLPLVKFWYSIEEYPNYLKRLLKCFFPTTQLGQGGFSSILNQNRLSQQSQWRSRIHAESSCLQLKRFVKK